MKNKLYYLFCLFFAVFPFLNYSSFLYFPTTTRSITVVGLAGLLGLVCGVILLWEKSRLLIIKAPIFLVIGLGLISIILAGWWGLDWHNTFWSVTTRMTGIWYLLNLGLIMWLLWLVLEDPIKAKQLILIVVISTALYSVLAWSGPEGINWFFKNYSNDGFTFGNSTFAGMYLFGAFLLALYYVLQAETKRWWMYVLPVILVINPYIINHQVWSGNFSNGLVGEARASAYVIGLSLVGLALLWAISKIKSVVLKAKVSYALFVLALLTFMVATWSLLLPGGYLRGVYLDQASAARPLVWELSEKAIKERPYLGYGSDNFERVYEVYYDNRLLQDEYGVEAWFDRAHNIFIDQLLDNGLIGLIIYLLAYVVIIWSLIYVALNNKKKDDRLLAGLLILYFPLHLAELQTAFDTSISYPMLALLTVLAAILWDRTFYGQDKKGFWVAPNYIKYLVAVTTLIFSFWSLFFGVVPFVLSGWANGYIRTIGSSEKRLPIYPTLLGSPIDRQAILWRTATDFERGISENPKVLDQPAKVENLKKELALLVANYQGYVKQNPTNFRAHLNLADVLIYSRLFGVDHLAEAQTVLDQAISIVPQSPQPYWMKSVAYIYMGKFDLARDYAKKGLALNPNITQSQVVVTYVENSIKTFPEIDLFFFTQI